MAAAGASAQSLAELYSAARVYDASFLAAQSLVLAADARITQAESARRASATADATASRTEADLPGRSLAGTTGVGASLNGRYPLYNRGTQVDINRAGKAVDVARGDVESAEQDLIVRLAQAYFDVLASQDALSTTQASKKAITEQLASAKRNFEVGTATITDTREAQARFDPGHGAGNCRRQRPAHQAHCAGPAGGPQRRGPACAGGAGGAAGHQPGPSPTNG